MYTFMNIYTGGGVAIGDINNDGLDDIFFSGNRVSSRLYLNKGNLEFEDITIPAKLQTDRWCSGASMVDINNDGYLDIYCSVTGVGTEEELSNLLFINQGDNTFTEQAEMFNLNERKQVMHTSFFDYDRDGDLDAFMIVNPVNYTLSNVNNVKEKLVNGESESTDKLYRNDGTTFTDVSTQAGILIEGYSLGVSTTDINEDGWPDIYISNDFLTNDILYINNQDGTFTNKAKELLDHTSFAGMGNDVSDFNNDGHPDIMVVDMLPEDNLRRQTIIPASSFDKFNLTLQMGYEPQYTRNTLQYNNGDGTFSEIGQLAGIDKTDWSWSSLFADYDNDGDKDLYITNGFLRDVGNLDYISYQREVNASPFGKKDDQKKNRLKAIQDLGAAKIQNYIYENKEHLSFEHKNSDWGMMELTCSNGAAFSDLDNDGDLELIVNNVNDKASIFKNFTSENMDGHFMIFKLSGSSKNPNGIGTKIELYTSSGMQFYEHNIYRGYASTVSHNIHFGLGEASDIDSVIVTWSDGIVEKMFQLSGDTSLLISHSNATMPLDLNSKQQNEKFVEISTALGLTYQHKENDFIDFKLQPLLPHKHSQNGPGISVGDVNRDGLDDVFIGGAAGSQGALYIQKIKNSKNTRTQYFEKSNLTLDKESEDMGTLFFDADSDGDQDLYVVSGGSSFLNDTIKYQDRLYENDGNGNFNLLTESLPKIYASGSSVSAADFDKDGDLDLIVGGRIVPGSYPLAAQTFLLKNESSSTGIKFIDISKTNLPKEGRLGMVTSVLWTDYDNDNWLDLMIVGEFMSITFIKNNEGTLDHQNPIAIKNSSGWWNSLVAGDFDQDGDIDYVAGNLGLNSRWKATVEKPFCVYASDYDKNGRVDPVFCQYIGNERFIAHPRDLVIQQINAMRVRFKRYEEYGSRTFEKSFTKEELESSLLLKTTTFESTYIENKGNGNFKLNALPIQAQFAPIFGMQVDDINGDDLLDVILVGNSSATEVSVGNYDAYKGGVLFGNGNGKFEYSAPSENGFYLDADAKGIASIFTENFNPLYFITNNSGSLVAYQKQNMDQKTLVTFNDNDQHIILYKTNGQLEKRECYHGNTYLSQSSRKIILPNDLAKIEIYDTSGEMRTLQTN